jgi:hypothetical protein
MVKVTPRETKKPVATDMFDDPMLAQFCHIFHNYADDLLSLMQTHVISQVKISFEKAGEQVDSKSPAFVHVYGQTWRDFLKHCRKWDRKLLDQEVVRIFKSMAGLVVDLDSDSESDSEEDKEVSTEELSSYRDTLQTYLEYARWTLMSSLTASDADPVDDIPAVALADFVCYFVDTLTRQRAVKKNLFLEYDETNQYQVIRPCLVNALQRTIPRAVYQALLKARLENSKNACRNRSRSTSSYATSHSLNRSSGPQPLVSSGLLKSDMMSSRAIAARMNTDGLRNTMASAASSVAMPAYTPKRLPKPVRKERQEDKSEEPPRDVPQVMSTAHVKSDAISSSPEDVLQVNLDESMRTEDFRSSAASRQEYTGPTLNLNAIRP